MRRWALIAFVAAVTSAAPRPASADWLLTGFVAPIFNVKTSESESGGIAPEDFDSSVGFGVNLASAFPTRGNLGFELDWASFPKGLQESSVYGTAYASRIMTISTNFFYSPGVPRVRPYFAIGPTFSYRSDTDEALSSIDSGWAVGINGGGGIFAFVNPRFGARVDLRYFRNFGDFYDLDAPSGSHANGWNNLRFFRLFFGGTVVL